MYARLEQYEKAIEDFSKAIQLNPGTFDAYLSRGASYSNLGLYESAIPDLNEAIGRNPDSFKGYYNRGLAHCSLDQLFGILRKQ